MTIFYLDIVNGNDANAGTTWALAKKTFSGLNALTITGGDDIRVAKNTVEYTRTGLTYAAASGSYYYLVLNQAVGLTLVSGWQGAYVSWTANTGYTGQNLGSMGDYNYISGALTAAAVYVSSGIPATNYKLMHRTITGTNISSMRRINVQWNLLGWSSLSSGNNVGWNDPLNPKLELWLCSDTLGNTPLYKVPLTRSFQSTTTAHYIDINFNTWDNGSNFSSTLIQSLAVYTTTVPIASESAYVGITSITAVPADPLIQPTDLIWIPELKGWHKVSYIHDAGTTPWVAFGNVGLANVDSVPLASNTVRILRAPLFSTLSAGTAAIDNFYKDGTSPTSLLGIHGGYNTATNVQDGYTVWMPNCGSNGKNQFPVAMYTNGTSAQAPHFMSLSKLIVVHMDKFLSSTSSKVHPQGHMEVTDCHVSNCSFLDYSSEPMFTTLTWTNCSFITAYGLVQGGPDFSGSYSLPQSVTFDNCGFLGTLTLGIPYPVTAPYTYSDVVVNACVFAGNAYLYIRTGGNAAQGGSVTFSGGNVYTAGGTVRLHGPNDGNATAGYEGSSWSINGLDINGGTVQIYGGGVVVTGSATNCKALTLQSTSSTSMSAGLIYASGFSVSGPNTYVTLAGVVLSNSTIAVNPTNMQNYLTLYQYVELINCDVGNVTTTNSYGIKLSTAAVLRAFNTIFRNAAFTTGGSRGNLECYKCTFLGNTAGSTPLYYPTIGNSTWAGSILGNKFILCNFPAGKTFADLGMYSGKYSAFTPSDLGYDYPGVVLHKDGVINATTYFLPSGSATLDATVVHTAGGRSLKYVPLFPAFESECEMHFLQVSVQVGVLATIGFWVYQVGSVRVRMKAHPYQISAFQPALDTGVSNVEDSWVYVFTTFTPDATGVIRFRLGFENPYSATGYANHYAYVDDWQVSQ